MALALNEIVMSMRSLQPFPQVAAAVLQLSQQPGTVPNDLIETIQTDPALVGKVLKLCNSAYYGFQREVASIREAGNMLGTETLVSLVMTTCANRYFQSHAKNGDPDAEALWARCVTNAVASRLLAQHHGRTDPDRAYTAGLLQNVGEVVLSRYMAEHRTQVEAEIACGRNASEAERVILGMHHAEVGARLAKSWSLPDLIVDTIRYHHDPSKAKFDVALVSTTHLAETMTFASLDKNADQRLRHQPAQIAMEVTGLHAEDFEGFDIELSAELVKAEELLRG